MLSALLYLQSQSIRNRFIAQVKRLKKPKYLLFGSIGVLYFYFYLLSPFTNGGHHNHAGTNPAPSTENLVMYETIAALVLVVFTLMAWIIPHERAALTFTEAEIAFLFPAPVTRRGLIHFKLLRSQAAIFFTTIFLALFSRRFGGGSTWIHAATWWLVLSILNLHTLGASFARTILMDRGITNWARRIVIFIAVAVIAAAIILWARQSIPAADLKDLDNFSKIGTYARQVFSSGPLPYLLAPFRWAVQPYFAPDARAFFFLVWPAVALLALHYFWVVMSDVAFEEASLEASRKSAEKIAAIRSGNWRAAKQKKAVRSPFRLASAGFPPIALLWKNLISAGQAFTARIWIWLTCIAIVVVVSMKQYSSDSPAHWSIAISAAMFLGWLLLFGSQLVRHDFRQDLLMADALKVLPLPAWQIALGELLAPAVILTGIQWCLLILAAGVLPTELHSLSPALILEISFTAAIIFPFFNVISLLIPNAAVLMFPAWFQLGKSGPQGIEATGQRIIFLLGQLVVLVITLVPAALAFIGVGYPVYLFAGISLAIPVAALASAIILACEAALGVKFLGTLFQRFDLSAELPA
jgi:hypothetical protein